MLGELRVGLQRRLYREDDVAGEIRDSRHCTIRVTWSAMSLRNGANYDKTAIKETRMLLIPLTRFAGGRNQPHTDRCGLRFSQRSLGRRGQKCRCSYEGITA